MDKNQLRDLLAQLHDEINAMQSVDTKGGELLKDLDSDIRSLLERSGEIPGELHPSLVRRLEQAVDQFEITHPDLTLLISNLLDSLSSAGI